LERGTILQPAAPGKARRNRLRARANLADSRRRPSPARRPCHGFAPGLLGLPSVATTPGRHKLPGPKWGSLSGESL